MGWLMPRLSEFRDEHPEVELMLNPTAEARRTGAGGIDVGVPLRPGRWRGLDAELLVPTTMASSSPRTRADRRPPDRRAARHPRPALAAGARHQRDVQLAARPRRHRAAARRTSPTCPATWCSRPCATATASPDRPRLVERDIDAGRLIVLFEDELCAPGRSSCEFCCVASRPFIRGIGVHQHDFEALLCARPRPRGAPYQGNQGMGALVA